VGAPIGTASVGPPLFAVTGTDNAGNAETLTHGYGVVFCVNPFASPVDDLHVLNRVNAGKYVWKTETSWAGSRRQLVLLLSDGTYRRVNFQFR
jgi:hypothetical protein